MGFFESEASIASSYYLLHTADYYDDCMEFAEHIKDLALQGHELGIHNNFIGLYYAQKEAG